MVGRSGKAQKNDGRKYVGIQETREKRRMYGALGAFKVTLKAPTRISKIGGRLARNVRSRMSAGRKTACRAGAQRWRKGA